MDKNKSAFKLQGLPHIYWINLDRATDRRSFMEMQFKYWGIENHTRISAYDGSDESEDDVTQYLKGRVNECGQPDSPGCRQLADSPRLAGWLGCLGWLKMPSQNPENGRKEASTGR